jgi:hypothetical protein
MIYRFSRNILIMASDASENITFGSRVNIQGLLQHAKYNGKLAVVIALADPQTGRYGVRFENGDEVRIKPENMDLRQQTHETRAAGPSVSTAHSDVGVHKMMVDYGKSQGFSMHDVHRIMEIAEKKKTDDVIAAIKYAASVKKQESVKQHLASFGLNNVIRHCGNWSRFSGMMKILARLHSAGASDAATLRMLFGNEQHVAGIMEEVRDMQGMRGAAGSASSAMGGYLFQHESDDDDEEDEEEDEDEYEDDDGDKCDQEELEASHREALLREEQRAAEVHICFLMLLHCFRTHLAMVRNYPHSDPRSRTPATTGPGVCLCICRLPDLILFSKPRARCNSLTRRLQQQTGP